MLRKYNNPLTNKIKENESKRHKSESSQDESSEETPPIIFHNITEERNSPSNLSPIQPNSLTRQPANKNNVNMPTCEETKPSNSVPISKHSASFYGTQSRNLKQPSTLPYDYQHMSEGASSLIPLSSNSFKSNKF